jgi:O-antigen ligase
VALQAIFTFFGCTVVYRKMKTLLNLNRIERTLLLVVLIFPFFPPLEVAHNLTSEGISYPLYLLWFSFSCDVLFRDRSRRIALFAICFLALALTRGQFVVVPLLVSFIYILRFGRSVFTKNRLGVLAILVLLPIVAGLLDSAYHKAVHGYFVKTPYTFVNAVTLPLFVSEERDRQFMDDPDTAWLFEHSYQRIDSLGLLSSAVNGGPREQYKVFHNHFPVICNQNLHEQGKAYFLETYGIPHYNFIQTEQAAKNMFMVLVPQHFEKWATLYITGIVHGFKSVIIFIFVLFVAVYSLWKTLRSFGIAHVFLCLSSLLILSNAFIVGIASHSIMRYLFYNYFLGLLIVVLLIRKIPIRP